MAEPHFPYVEIDASAEEAQELGAWLFELGASGIELRDDTTLSRGPGDGRVQLVASFAERATAERARAALAVARPELVTRVGETIGDAWRDKYKEHFAPFALSDRIAVVPPWVSEPDVGQRQRLLMDPGRAFGTGLHATTSLVAQALERYPLADQRVLDVGTGSGILALVALLLGAAEALGIDCDPEAIEVARENAARNGLEGRLRLSTTPVERISERFAVVLANIETRVLGPMAPALLARLEPGGLLFLSGVLASEEQSLRARFLEAGPLRHLETTARGDGGDAWVALVLRAG